MAHAKHNIDNAKAEWHNILQPFIDNFISNLIKDGNLPKSVRTFFEAALGTQIARATGLAAELCKAGWTVVLRKQQEHIQQLFYASDKPVTRAQVRTIKTHYTTTNYTR